MFYALLATLAAYVWDFCSGVANYWIRSTADELLADFLLTIGALVVLALIVMK